MMCSGQSMPHWWRVLIALTALLGHLSGLTQGALPNPRIVEHPKDGYVAKNEPATLNCKAEGNPKPVVTWYRNGRKVVTSEQDPSSHRLLLDDQLFFLRIIHNKNNKPDIGVYYCKATNIHGSVVSRNATLEIAVLRDDFRETPQNTMVAVDEKATLRCRPPKGEPEAHVRWVKDGEKLAQSSRVSVSEQGDLLFAQTQKSDTGMYTCIAYNKAGEKESNPVKLSVLERPKIVKTPEDVQVDETKDAVFNCKATGDPQPTIIWRKEEGQIPSGRARLLDDKSLFIEKAQVSDEGLYICQAENSVGSTEAVARLSVHSHPAFVVTPSDKVVGVGRTLTLQCQVEGNPPPAVFWSRGTGQELMFPKQDHGRFSVGDDGTFRVENIQHEDAGEYQCQALSVAGSAVATVKIEVRDSVASIPDHDPRPPPLIQYGPQNQTLPVNSLALIPCQASGDPQPIIRWYKDSRPIALTDPRITILDSGSLQISDLRISDSGIYACKAMSETGEALQKASLVVAVPSNPSTMFHRIPDPGSFPNAPSKPMADDQTERSVHLSWRRSSREGASSIKGYRIEYFSPETGEGWLVIPGMITRDNFIVRHLRPDTSYIFVVRAINSHGMGPPSQPSAKIRTKDSRHGYDHTRIASKPNIKGMSRPELEKRLSGTVVEVTKADPRNSSEIGIQWRVVKGHDVIQGFNIRYTYVINPNLPEYGKTNVDKVNNPAVNFHVLKNLKSYAWYEIRIQAFAGPVNSRFSEPIRVQTYEGTPSAPPRNILVHKDGDSRIHVRWSPPLREDQNGIITGYLISLFGNESKYDQNITTNATTFEMDIDKLHPGVHYSIKMAAFTKIGLGVSSKLYRAEPEAVGIMREPWFIGMLIGTIGGTLWLALCIFSIWLCRKRKSRKKLVQNSMYNVPVHKPPEEHIRNDNSMSSSGYHDRKDGHFQGSMPPDLTNLLDKDAQEENVYNTAGLLPHMKTFYNKPNTVPIPVAPYASTTIINTGGQFPKPLPGESVFRPINQGYIHQGSGSSDSCIKPDINSSGSNTDNSRPNTGITTIYSLAEYPVEGPDGCHSPAGDSSGYTTGTSGYENGMPIRRKMHRGMKQQSLKQPVVNWAELLPPPPEHPPPPSEMGTPPDSPSHQMRIEMTSVGPQLSVDFDHYSRGPDSPVSECGPDYTGSMLATWASVTDNSNTSCSSVRSSACSSDGSFLTEADFASAVAKAAELSGLTVVGSTVSDPKAGKRHHHRRHRAPRPTSPYSTDSNFSAVVHKPYPKSQRKKQLLEQGNRRQSGSHRPQAGAQQAHSQASQSQSQPTTLLPSTVADLPTYHRPNFPSPYQPSSCLTGMSNTTGKQCGLSPCSSSLLNGAHTLPQMDAQICANPLAFTMENHSPAV
ncbi:roundabout homolog 1-like isoform X2 [Liolophura sinensis]|uniref:roundabout homolog 1-like isoform X2 n=1 Tax=Liolophura sinensis TaxID=3198878 RepID=UPI00315968E7